jgi:prevent-host-death family protein
MKTWSARDAKARFSQLLAACLQEGPQVVTWRGAEVAVLVPIAEWNPHPRAIKPTLKELLLSDVGRANLNIPPRRKRLSSR